LYIILLSLISYVCIFVVTDIARQDDKTCHSVMHGFIWLQIAITWYTCRCIMSCSSISIRFINLWEFVTQCHTNQIREAAPCFTQFINRTPILDGAYALIMTISTGWDKYEHSIGSGTYAAILHSILVSSCNHCSRYQVLNDCTVRSDFCIFPI